MALDYDIYISDGNYYEVRIPVANYYKDEGLLPSATVCNNWKGFNDELYSWERIGDKIILSDDDTEEIIYALHLEKFKQWLDTLNIYSHLDMFEPILNILESLESSDNARVSISFG